MGTILSYQEYQEENESKECWDGGASNKMSCQVVQYYGRIICAAMLQVLYYAYIQETSVNGRVPLCWLLRRASCRQPALDPTIGGSGPPCPPLLTTAAYYCFFLATPERDILVYGSLADPPDPHPQTASPYKSSWHPKEDWSRNCCLVHHDLRGPDTLLC